MVFKRRQITERFRHVSEVESVGGKIKSEQNCKELNNCEIIQLGEFLDLLIVK